jgi:DNA invertase Pin-like site-specific DNA recombinase
VVHWVVKKCALYARVSTRKEKGKQDPEVQLRLLREFAASQGWELTEEFVDRESGTKADRPAFIRMMQSASRHEFDILLFWSLDRFSREGILPTLTTLKRLTDYRVKYRSFEETYIDTTNEWGDLIAAFAAKLAELEHKRIKARIAAGLAKAKADGTVLGRPRVIIDRTKVWKLKDTGKSIREIAVEMDYSHGTVQRALEARRKVAA